MQQVFEILIVTGVFTTDFTRANKKICNFANFVFLTKRKKRTIYLTRLVVTIEKRQILALLDVPRYRIEHLSFCPH